MRGIFEKVFFYISFLYFSLNNKDQHKINERSFVGKHLYTNLSYLIKKVFE
jgi:hypothetical protein